MSDYQRQLIGITLDQYSSCIEKILESGITRNDFTGELREIWSQVEKAFASGNQVSLVKIGEAMPNCYAELEDCFDKAPPEAMLDAVIEDVKSESMIRKAKEAVMDAQEMLERCTTMNAKEAVADIQKSFLDLRVDVSQSMSLPDAMTNFIERCKDGNLGDVPWPIERIQKRYGNLSEEFIVIHALPSIGKTALVVQWMTYLSRLGIKSALASLESSVDSIAPRFMSHIGQVNSLRMKCGDLNPVSEKRALDAVERAKSYQQFMQIKDGHMTDGQLMAWCRIQKQNGAKIIFIDNLRHIDSVTKYESEVRKFMEISLAVKRIRDQIRIPVCLLHHSSEDGNIGWSRDIRKDVDIEIALERSEVTYGAEDIDDIIFNFKKARDAGCFAIESKFDKQHQTYREI